MKTLIATTATHRDEHDKIWLKLKFDYVLAIRYFIVMIIKRLLLVALNILKRRYIHIFILRKYLIKLN